MTFSLLFKNIIMANLIVYQWFAVITKNVFY